MVSSDDIYEKENRTDMLKIQYAARKCFNNAERLNYCALVACIIATFSIVLPNNLPIYIVYGVPFLADIFATIFSFYSDREVEWASKLRRYFDYTVLEIMNSGLSKDEIRSVKERAEYIYNKNVQEANIQMANNGNDFPPGVKDWYVFKTYQEGLPVKFECQKQNFWWNKKMTSKRFVVDVAGVIFLIISMVLLCKYNGYLKTFLCSAGIIIKICGRVYANWQYSKISNKIEGSLLTIENNLSEQGIETLQQLIDARRSINVLEIGLLHKKMAKKLTKLYNQITE